MLDEQKNMFYVGWDANLPVGKEKKEEDYEKCFYVLMSKGIV